MFKRFAECFWLALDTLRTNKFRSMLTILGVVIGTCTVMTVAGFISGLDQQFSKMIDSFVGRRSVFVFKFDPTFNGGNSPEERMRKALTLDDAIALKESCPSLELVTPRVSPWDADLRVHANGEEIWSINGQCAGVWPEYGRMDTASVDQGRFFNEYENQTRRQVAVIGADVASTLWPNMNAVGKKLGIDNNEVEVVGILKRQDNFVTPDEDTGNMDRAILLPYNTMLKFFPSTTPGMDEIAITVQFREGMRDQAMDQMREVLRARRHCKPGEEDNFAFVTADSFMGKLHQITFGIALLSFALSGAGLLIGGIGVMNIMLVSVTERTKEIGIRKAIGAKKSDITTQFLIEAMTLTGLGGLLGLASGYGIVMLVNLILPVYVPSWAPVAGFGFSLLIGLVFGFWPAVRAARLDPIVALRYE
jgi:putative ABC transport system permease protein